MLTLTRQPEGGERYSEQSFTFSTAVTDNEGDVHYDWRHDGDSIGLNTNELSISFLTLGDAGEYWCVISDVSETVTTARVRCGDRRERNPPHFTSHPTGGVRLEGRSLILRAEATQGFAPLTYQMAAQRRARGQRSASLGLVDLSVDDSGEYVCTVLDRLARAPPPTRPPWWSPPT